MKYLSRKQAIRWLNRHITFGETGDKFDNKIMKMLDKTCRLMPIKNTLFGKRYSLEQLKQYVRDVKPR